MVPYHPQELTRQNVRRDEWNSGTKNNGCCGRRNESRKPLPLSVRQIESSCKSTLQMSGRENCVQTGGC